MGEKIYSIGIDVSKKTLDVCFLRENFKTLTSFKVNNTNKGIQELHKNISLHTLHKEASIVLESTSTYHVLPILLLQNYGYKVKVFNPIISNKYAKASIRKCKTDKIDAKRIAEIGLLEDIPESKLNKSEFSIKRKVSILQTLTKQKQILSASFKQIKEDYQNLGIELSTSLEEIQANIKHLEKVIKELESEICKDSKKLKGFDNISKIRGISEKSVGIILSHLHNKEFNSREAITAFAGLDISVKQSGTSVKGKGSVSKRGNTMLRKTLTQAAWGLRMHNESFQKLVAYYQERGKHYFEIMTILARKLLHIIYGILKHNSPFDPTKITIPNKKVLTCSV